MHEAGIKYDLIACYFKINTTTLRKHMRKHENNTEQVLWAASKGRTNHQ